MPVLEEARREIDEIDAKMADLFERRMAAAARVAAFKQQNGLPVLDAGREAAVVEKNLARLQNAVLAPYYTDYIKGMMALSRQYQTQILGSNTAAYQGAKGGFGHRVAGQLYPRASLAPKPTFAAVFEAVESGEVAHGVVPFENSTTGDVSGILDLCYSHNCFITAMYDLPVSQNLLALPNADITGIKTVVSHVQALEQCKRFLQNLGAELVPYSNTAAAAEYVAGLKDPTVAAIAGLEAGERYGLVPIVKDIATDMGNTTRFISIAQSPGVAGGRFSLLFTVENTVGQLAKVIEGIAAEGFNMESIKSRPIPQKTWQYYFYAELVGEGGDAEALLAALRPVCLTVRLLGVFDRLQPKA